MSNRRVILFALVLVCAAASLTDTADPPARLDIPKAQLVQMKDLGIDLLNSSIKGLSFPDQTIVKKILGITYHIKLTDIKVNEFSANSDNTEITLQAPNMVTLDTAVDDFELEFNMEYRFITKHSGPGHLKTKSTTLHLESTWTTTEDNKFNIDFADAKLDLGSVNIQIGDDVFSKIINWVVGALQKLFLPSLESYIAKAVDDEVDTFIDKALSKFAMTLALGKSGYGFDFSPIGQPVINESFIEVGINGDIFNETVGPAVIDPQHSIPAFTSTDPYATISLTNTLVNLDYTKLVTAFDINFTVTQDTLPDMVKIRFDTQDMDVLFPGIYDYYGANQQCEFVMSPGTKGGVTMDATNNALIVNPELDVTVKCNHAGSDTDDVPEEYISFGLMVKADFRTVAAGTALYIYDNGFDYESIIVSDDKKERIDQNELIRVMKWVLMFGANTANGHIFIDNPIQFKPIDGFEIQNMNLNVQEDLSMLTFDLMPQPEFLMDHINERIAFWSTVNEDL